MNGKKKTRKERHTFTVGFEACLLFEPKTSFPDFCGGVGVDNSSSFPFTVGLSSCSVDSVCVFPSKRFPDPVNGVNLGTLLAGSSSSTAITTQEKKKTESTNLESYYLTKVTRISK